MAAIGNDQSDAGNNTIIAKSSALQSGTGEGVYIHKDFETEKRALGSNGLVDNFILTDSERTRILPRRSRFFQQVPCCLISDHGNFSSSP